MAFGGLLQDSSSAKQGGTWSRLQQGEPLVQAGRAAWLSRGAGGRGHPRRESRSGKCEGRADDVPVSHGGFSWSCSPALAA